MKPSIAADYWNQLCISCRADILDDLGFLNPIYQHYRFEDFQPHSQRDIATKLAKMDGYAKTNRPNPEDSEQLLPPGIDPKKDRLNS